ncbi:MAG: M48 family metalloprotease [Okeania sp. SIO2G5]|nr:M48 family metalloprotease [Okeania sp. SIO2G5]
MADEQWLQAAIASRQFALLEPDHPESETFNAQADEYQDRFRRKMRRRLTRTAIGNAIAGAVGFAVTGSWFGPLSAIETTILMIRGESAVGERIANNARDELDMVEDEVVLDYVNEIGQELAELGGRTEFDYEFYVVAEDELNAFALPGGKIFINAGAITRTDTGAELAGLIAHELAHAILSHGFQQVTRGNLTANVLQFVPYGGLATNLTVLRYSRDMERQADRLGTRLLATSPYAADGVRNLMQTLLEESENRSRFDWLSTHPNTSERVRNMERLIEQNGYNRYAFEDIERHLLIRERVEEILIEMEKIDLDLEDDEDTVSEEDSESNPSNEDLRSD